MQSSNYRTKRKTDPSTGRYDECSDICMEIGKRKVYLSHKGKIN